MSWLTFFWIHFNDMRVVRASRSLTEHPKGFRLPSSLKLANPLVECLININLNLKWSHQDLSNGMKKKELLLISNHFPQLPVYFKYKSDL